MFLKKGYHTQDAEALKEKVEKNDGHYLNCSKEEEEEWKKVLPLSKNSRTGLLLDEATFVYAAKEKKSWVHFYRKRISVYQKKSDHILPALIIWQQDL